MTTNYPLVGIIFITICLSLLFAYTSVSYSYTNALANPTQMNPDWRESMEWMGNNTPETGVNYFTIYDQKTFKYPASSYGVMSWWDYGHLITYIGKRIPNANPFQQGVAGPDGAAAYFMSTDEDKANAILDHDGTRYVVTDIEMDTGKFWAMSTWDNATLATDPYQMTMLVQSKDNPNSYDPARMDKQEYYMTTISRLHNFDGSMVTPSTAYYIEYADPSVTNVAYPVVITAEKTNAADAKLRADQYNLKALPGHHAEVMNPDSTADIVHPIDTVPALQHYRLVQQKRLQLFRTLGRRQQDHRLPYRTAFPKTVWFRGRRQRWPFPRNRRSRSCRILGFCPHPRYWTHNCRQQPTEDPTRAHRCR